MQYFTKAGNFKFDVQTVLGDNFRNFFCHIFWMGQLNGWVDYMKVRMSKNTFRLTFNREIIITLLENNCFDYCFQVLFANVTG